MSENIFHFGTVGLPKSTPKNPGGTIGALPHLKSIGLDSLELGWVRSVHITESACLSIREGAEKNDIFLSVHAPYFINLNAIPEKWYASKERLLNAAYFGNLAGSTDVIFHPGSLFGIENKLVYPIIIKRLAECLQTLSNQNNRIILRTETMGKQALLGSLDDVLWISRELPGIEPCLDFAHLHARQGDGSMNTIEEWLHLLERYAAVLGEKSLKRLHCHISGIEYTKKGERKHLPLQESDLNINAILSALLKFNCSGRILCESPLMEEDAILIKKIWEQKIL